MVRVLASSALERSAWTVLSSDLSTRFPNKDRVDRSEDRTVQADRSKADDAADRREECT